MPRIRSQVLLLAYCGLLLAASVVGCSTREKANETLPMDGNHSPGELVMVTTDTSSDGYLYLEPELSPDGTRVLFSADWPALPPPGQTPDPIPTIRQLVIMPYRTGTQPEQLLSNSGAFLVPFQSPCNIVVDGSIIWPAVYPLTALQKGGGTWLNDDTILYWMHVEKGDRLFTGDLTQPSFVPQVVYLEPDDRVFSEWRWQHHDPSISPDGHWVAFSRFGVSSTSVDSLQFYTKQALWLVSLDRTPQVAMPLTSDATLIGAPAWSPDGRIAFYSTLDLVGGSTFYGTEIFSITVNLAQAAAGSVPLDQGLRRLTFTSIPEGNPIPIQNRDPDFSADGSMLVFTSDRRAPSITLHDRSIWRIPSDGRLEPVIAFFTRDDDVDAKFLRGSNDRLILSSAVGFPTEMLNRLEQEAAARIRLENPELTELQVAELAAAQRGQLEYFERVMSHVFVFKGW